MADNTTLNPGSGGDVIATDAVTSINGQASENVKVQQVKVGHGQDGIYNDATPQNPLPVVAYGELVDAVESLRMAVHSLTRTIGQVMPDVAGRQRVLIDAISGGLTLAAVTTVSTVSTVTNQTNMGGFAATEQIPSLMRLGADALRRNITIS